MNPPFLIADDTPPKMAMLVNLVKRSGWKGKILTAVDTDEAKELIDANPTIAAAFIDYNMPRENGPAVIEYLKEKNPEAHIALVTSADGKKYRDDAMEAGAEAFVTTADDADAVEKKLMALVADWMTLIS